MNKNTINLSYDDIDMFISIIEERALKSGTVIHTLDDLREYMYDYPDETFRIVTRLEESE
ncbi:hypothetical protein [Virgibacillus dokdonensis]|uniref:hypothetical protein n=1 Tax=Virgibacillus dokdonensis TaxID=302167 RepID=UPI000989B0C6|nr:hypothetical protein [Virgibacillus dokdonensis]